MLPAQVEIHIPLDSADGDPQVDAFPWIHRVLDLLVTGAIEGGYDGPEAAEVHEGHLVLVIEGPDDSVLVERARVVARTEDVPRGVYAVVRSGAAADDLGARVDLQESL